MDKIRKKIDESFSKGLINEVEFLKANIQYDNLLEKASKGEGSRGGKIIGHTKSGKPVYDTKAAGRDHYKNFTVEDHNDAAMIHRKRSAEHDNKSKTGYSTYAKQHHAGMKEWHDDTAKSHEYHADKKRKTSTTPTEKEKTSADQKKKQNEQHQRSYDYHKEQIDRYENEPELLHENHHLNSYNFHKDRADFHKRSIEKE